MGESLVSIYRRLGKHGLAVAGAVIITLAMAAPIQAATVLKQGGPPPPVVQPACNVGSVTLSTACQTVPGNNDNLASMNAGSGVFLNTDWLLADKSDAVLPTIPSVNLSFTAASNLLTGTWSVGSFGGYTKAALVVKGGGEAWVAYFLNLTTLSGSWSTADLRNNGGNQPKMSHLSLYVADYVPPAPVPVPAAASLLLLAFGALAALRRKRRA
jgi:hypothetical protein